MIQPFSLEFLTPTKKLRRLSVMLAIHNEPQASQHKIGKGAHLSSSMVNNYMKTFHQEKLLTVSGNTNRTQSYYLTTSGRDELISSLVSYSAEIIQLYAAAKRELAKRLQHMHADGIHTIALFGAADTAEVVHAALKCTPMVVKAVVDSDREKQGKPFNGLIIQPPEVLKNISIDAVVITSFARQEEIHESVRQFVGQDIKVKKLSDF